MNRTITLCLGLASALAAADATAQCLTSAQRAAFEAAILTQLNASRLSVSQLEHHALERLGPGARAVRATGTDAERKAALASRIAASLANAARVPTTVEDELAAVTVTRPNPQRPPEVYRHAATTMTEAYSELADLRERYLAEPDPDKKDALRALYNGAIGDLRETGPARELAILLLAGSPDLGAMMGEFWANHFNVSSAKSPWSMVDYQRALRAGQCGSFRALLGTSAKHPAMLIYLDNLRSKVDNINENYARELLELHTFGDDRLRYYDQADIREVAAVLTGWSVGFTEISAGVIAPSFRFFRASHDPVAVDLFEDAPLGVPLHLAAAAVDGRGVPTDAAVSRGEALLDYLAGHVATRRNLCGKLARRLLGVASAEIVDGCAAAGVWGTSGDLGAVYRYLLTRPEMWGATPAGSPTYYLAKAKNPIEIAVSAYRRTNPARTDILNATFLRTALRNIDSMGIAVGKVPPPTGYADDARWRNPGTLLRWGPAAFNTLDTARLSHLGADGVVRSGAALENYVSQRVFEALDGNVDVGLRDLADELLTGMLGMPTDFRPLPSALRGVFLFPDRRKDNNADARVRSFTEAVLTGRIFVRK